MFMNMGDMWFGDKVIVFGFYFYYFFYSIVKFVWRFVKEVKILVSEFKDVVVVIVIVFEIGVFFMFGVVFFFFSNVFSKGWYV